MTDKEKTAEITRRIEIMQEGVVPAFLFSLLCGFLSWGLPIFWGCKIIYERSFNNDNR